MRGLLRSLRDDSSDDNMSDGENESFRTSHNTPTRAPNNQELITLICGHSAGYTAAHFFNTHIASAVAIRDADFDALQARNPSRTIIKQPPVLSDALFVPSRLSGGDLQAVPRAVFVDLHGACFASSAQRPPSALPHVLGGGVVQTTATQTFSAWSGRIAAMGDITPSIAARDPETAEYIRHILAAASGEPQQPPVSRERLAERSVADIMRRPESWGDILGCRVDPRALCEVRGVTHGADAWGAWDDAADAVSGGIYGVREDVGDAVRRFAEGCDRVCGVQVVADMDNASAALTAALLADIRDDYSAAMPVAVLGVSALVGAGASASADFADLPSKFAGATSVQRNAVVARRRLCCALAAASWAEYSSIVVPLSCAPPSERPAQPRCDERTELERASFMALAWHGFARPYSVPPPELCSGRAPSQQWTLADVCETFAPAKFLASTIRFAPNAAPAQQQGVSFMPFQPQHQTATEKAKTFAVCSTRFGGDSGDAPVDVETARRKLWSVSSAPVVVPSSMQDTCVPADAGSLSLAAFVHASRVSVSYFDGLANALRPYQRGATIPPGFADMDGMSVADVSDALLDLRGKHQYVLE